VQIIGMRNRADLNGGTGVLLRYSGEDVDRWEVEVQGTGERVWCRPEKLVAVGKASRGSTCQSPASPALGVMPGGPYGSPSLGGSPCVSPCGTPMPPPPAPQMLVAPPVHTATVAPAPQVFVAPPVQSATVAPALDLASRSVSPPRRCSTGSPALPLTGSPSCTVVGSASPPRPTTVMPAAAVMPSGSSMTTRWCYSPPDDLGIFARATPEVEGLRTGHKLRPGDIFLVSEEREGAGGILFLKLAEGTGWVFNWKPGVGTMCVRHEATVLCNPEVVSRRIAELLGPGSSLRELVGQCFRSVAADGSSVDRTGLSQIGALVAQRVGVPEAALESIRDEDALSDLGGDNAFKEREYYSLVRCQLREYRCSLVEMERVPLFNASSVSIKPPAGATSPMTPPAQQAPRGALSPEMARRDATSTPCKGSPTAGIAAVASPLSAATSVATLLVPGGVSTSSPVVPPPQMGAVSHSPQVAARQVSAAYLRPAVAACASAAPPVQRFLSSASPPRRRFPAAPSCVQQMQQVSAPLTSAVTRPFAASVAAPPASYCRPAVTTSVLPVSPAVVARGPASIAVAPVSMTPTFTNMFTQISQPPGFPTAGGTMLMSEPKPPLFSI